MTGVATTVLVCGARALAVVVVLWGIVFCSVSCAPVAYDDPFTVMLDREIDPRFRRRAAQQAERQLAKDPRRIAVLYKLIREPGYPAWQRRDAINALLLHDEAYFHRKMSVDLASVRDPDALRHLLNQVIQRDWHDLTAAVVQSYTRRDSSVPDSDRPERYALERLNPGKTARQVAIEVFQNDKENVTTAQRSAAWELLCRLLSLDMRVQVLQDSLAGDSLTQALQASWDEAKVLPADRQGLAWLSYLLGSRPNDWASYTQAVSRLKPEQRRGVELRHLPVLAVAVDAVTRLGQNELFEFLVSRIDTGRKYFEIPHTAGSLPSPSQRLDDSAGRLTWADLVTIYLIDEALHDRGVIDALFSQAEADHNNPATEYGGVLDRQSGAFVAMAYEPDFSRHDRIFYPPSQMIEHLYTALAHYHFHAQQYRNHDFAGPGRGDLAFTERMGFNCLVFTFIDRDTLNVDYYQPNGVVIDLGVLTR